MNASLKTVFVCAVLCIAGFASRTAFPQARVAAGSTAAQFQVIDKATAGMIASAQFQAAQKTNDVRTMSAMLAPYGLQVLTPDPQMALNCQPPTGYPMWVWTNLYGSWMYAWVCLKIPPNEPIDLEFSNPN